MDKKKNNSINVIDLASIFEEIGCGLTDKEILVLFDFFDLDGNGVVDFQEYDEGI